MNHSASPDPRFTLFRPDLAADGLQGTVDATRYVKGAPREIITDTAPLRRLPRADARLLTEGLLGESFTVLEEREGWAWGQLGVDDYVGYAPAAALGAPTLAKTHMVRALRTYIYPAPDLKSPPLALVSLGARISAGAASGDYLEVPGQGFIFADHLALLGDWADDFVAVAEQFLGTPYYWGGRTSLGLDCSALIQLSLATIGVAASRDTDVQELALGVEVAKNCAAASLPNDLRRGDLVFWRGHVGVMLDAGRLLHANAAHMQVAIEPLVRATARIEARDGPVSSIRRF
ncbi:MAG: C40 family peptidase [Hyphomicrobiales bacterium]